MSSVMREFATGAIAFAVMPYYAPSMASDRVSPTMPSFAAA